MAGLIAFAVVIFFGFPQTPAQTQTPPVTFTTLVKFFSSRTGAYPLGGVIQGQDGNFYGTTMTGGSAGGGTVYKVTPSGDFTVLANFDASYNNYPANIDSISSSLVQGDDGNFYSTTAYGGAYGDGSVYRMAPDGNLTTLVNFKANRVRPSPGPLIKGLDGNLYGTTYYGGKYNQGTLFRLTPSGITTTLVEFSYYLRDSNGDYIYDANNRTQPGYPIYPRQRLIYGRDGNLYGSTDGQAGAGSNGSSIFRVSPNGQVTRLVDRAAVNLFTQGSDGYLYGSGGGNWIFRMTSGGFITPIVITPPTPIGFITSLVEGTDGNFYGTTSNGGGSTYCGNSSGCGTVFRMTPSGAITVLVSFSDNGIPLAQLVQGKDGSFYGTAPSQIGRGGEGIMFRLGGVLSPPPQNTDSATTPDDATIHQTCDGSMGMCVANAHTMLVSLNLNDTPEGYTPSIGPSPSIRLSYSHKEAGQPATFNYFNVGKKWTLNVLSYIQDDPTSAGQNVTRTVGGGGFYTQTGYNFISGAFAPEQQTQAILKRIPASGALSRYELALPDGSVYRFAKLDGATTSPRRVFLTDMLDPQGNELFLSYDAQNRLTSLIDATGKNTTLSYGSSNPLLVTRITDPFGRFANLTYDSSGRLSAITDVLGITSSFAYDTADPTFINRMTTPYGTSSFAGAEDKVANTRWLELTDPLGKTERLEFRPNAPGIAANPANVPAGINVANGSFAQYNSFYWDRHVKETVGSTDYTKAALTHWLTNSAAQTSPIISSTKAPLETPVYFNYPGQTQPAQAGATDQPSALGQMLDSSTAQVAQSSYNSVGNPTTITDPVGRVTLLTYAANGVDLTSRQQKTSASGYGQISGYSNYNAQHLPTQYTDAAGQVWRLAYNATGQIVSATNPLNQTRFWEYDSQSRLVRVTVLTTAASGAGVASAVSYNYSTACTGLPTPANTNLPISISDSEGWTRCYQYDALDRVIKVLYPDGTSDQYDYRFPDNWPIVAVRGTQSLDLWKATDRLGRVTAYGYDPDRRLIGVAENATVNGVATNRTTRYDYYANGALKNIIDANGNVTHWERDLQSRPISKTYAYGTPQAQTETYSYDVAGRLRTTTDAKGQVQTIAYNPDDTVASIVYGNTAVATPSASFAYDPYFPRRTSMTDRFGTTNWSYVPIGTAGALQVSVEDAPFANDTISYSYDALGRVISQAIPLSPVETFSYDVLGRLQTHGTVLGNFNYSYLGNSNQTTQRSVTNGTKTLTSAWGYDTNTNDRRLKAITHSGVARSYTITSNPYQITAIADKASAGHPWLSQNHEYSYDAADRLLTATATATSNSSFKYDALDNITQRVENGGVTDNPLYNNLNQVTRFAWWQNFEYDANGNTLTDTDRSYLWDGDDRLAQVTPKVGNVIQYQYDGLGRRIKKLIQNGGQTYELRFLWCGTQLCQIRNGADALVFRLYDEGEYRTDGPQSYVYLKDQLGSVRDMQDAKTGDLVTQVDYSPYGDRTGSSTLQPIMQFAGLQWDADIGLALSATRPYHSGAARWLNRDPIREAGGVNLYGYVGGSPISRIDPLGLYTEIIIWDPLLHPGSIFGHVSIDLNGDNWSFGPTDGGSWDTKYPSASDYKKRQQEGLHRGGMGYVLNATLKQEAKLKDCLQAAPTKYSTISNNCGTAAQACLRKAGIIGLPGEMLPHDLNGDLWWYWVTKDRHVIGKITYKPM